MIIYTHEQSVASKTWEIYHNLDDTSPMYFLYDENNKLINDDFMIVRYNRDPKEGPDANHIIIDFDVEWSGSAILVS